MSETLDQLKGGCNDNSSDTATTEENESNDNDSNDVTTEESERNDSDSNDATTKQEECNDNDNNDATTGEGESNDNNFYEELRKDFLKIAGIEEQKVIARDISTELNCGFRKALNRVQGKPKKRLDEMDEKIEEAIERFHQERLEL
jgi:hypothetical protein